MKHNSYYPSYDKVYGYSSNYINNYNYIDNYNYDYNYESSIRTKGVIGLKNINGSLCFMNSSLQCLAHIKPFYEKIVEKSQLKSLGLTFFELLVKMYDDSKDKNFIPNDILDAISSYYIEYKDGKQQGANEFISNFLKAFHEELNCSTYPKKIFNMPKEPLKHKFLKKYEFYNKNRSFIIDLFYGNILYLTICKECKNIINSLYSIFNILELSIYKVRDKKTISLKELIESYSSPEEINYDIFCNNCQKKVAAYSKVEIAHIPDVLIIYINKVIDHKYYANNINFPSELYLSNNNSQENNKKEKCYELIGIIEHFGSESVGHYISKCKNFIDGKWYRFNDSLVDKPTVPENNDRTTDSNSVIILFYQKRNN